MKKTLLLAALVAAAVAGRTAHTARAADPADLGELLPGIEVEHLSPPQREALARVAREEFCHCGCPHTVTQCLRTHKQCKHAPRMARLAARMAGAGLQAGEILKQLSEYYGSFERPRRARLDLGPFGPPMGDPKAPVALVEFSDFTCPYCQVLKPVLDDFVKGHAGRVKLFYKPFPLPNHPRSLEAAVTAEWARDAGVFWKVYDGLFAHPHELSDGDLAERAEEAGGDPTALRAALAAPALRARIQASQAEARAAGLRGTPTLFLNGRRYTLTDFSPAALEHALEDEEEWSRAGGWSKD